MCKFEALTKLLCFEKGQKLCPIHSLLGRSLSLLQPSQARDTTEQFISKLYNMRSDLYLNWSLCGWPGWPTVS
jgi:hypothetical protein